MSKILNKLWHLSEARCNRCGKRAKYEIKSNKEIKLCDYHASVYRNQVKKNNEEIQQENARQKLYGNLA